VAKLADTLNHEDPTPEIFDDIQRKVLIFCFLKNYFCLHAGFFEK
jgi:hypothetical protein